LISGNLLAAVECPVKVMGNLVKSVKFVCLLDKQNQKVGILFKVLILAANRDFHLKRLMCDDTAEIRNRHGMT
jgi:hypothetical protein